MGGADQLQRAGREARLLLELAARRLLWCLGLGTASLGDLPGIAVQRVAMLPDQPDAPFVIDRQDADGAVLELDNPIDARMPVWTQHLVLAHPDPRVLIHQAAAQSRPGIRRLGHDFPRKIGKYAPGRTTRIGPLSPRS